MSIDPKFIATMFDWSYDTLTKQIAGLTQEDSLIQPTGGGNCLNWQVGHIIASRSNLLPVLGEERVWSVDRAARYTRGSEPVTPENADTAFELEGMKLDLQNLQERTLSGLSRLTVADFDRPSDREGISLGQRLLLANRHECYHVGTTELLRSLAGKHENIL